MKSIPEVGKVYKFYDDGKVGSSRRYWAKVKKVLDIEETKNILVSIYDEDDWVKVPLYDVIQEEIRHCDWLYSKEQKEVICCAIPAYDCNDIWVIRDKTGGWFSINVQNSWQGGQLDVDNDYFDDSEYPWTTTWEDDVKHAYKPIEGHPVETFFNDEGQV